MYGKGNARPVLENRSLKISHHLSKYFVKLPQYHGHRVYQGSDTIKNEQWSCMSVTSSTSKNRNTGNVTK